MTFEKGQSGNSSGRPSGIKDRRTAFREMIEPHKIALMNKAVEMALGGDQQMLRLLLSRLLPAPPKDDMVDISLTEDSPTKKSNQIIEGLNSQDLTPSDAMNIMQTLAFQAKIYDTCEIKRLVEDIKDALAKR